MTKNLIRRLSVCLFLKLICLSLLAPACPAINNGDGLSTSKDKSKLLPKPATVSTAEYLVHTPNYPAWNCCLYQDFEREKSQLYNRRLSPIPSWKTYSEIKKLDERLTLFPSDAQYLEERAKEYFIAGCPLHALTDADSALKCNPFSHSAHVVKLLCYEQLHQHDEWLNELRASLTSANPNDLNELEYALNSMRIANVVKSPDDLSTMIPLVKHKTSSLTEQRMALLLYQLLGDQVRESFSTYDWKQASIDLQKMNHIHARSFVRHLQLAICYLRMGKANDALPELEISCELAPNESLCHLFKGLCLHQLGESRASEKEEQLAYELAADWTTPYDQEQAKLGREKGLTFDKYFAFVDTSHHDALDRPFFEDEKCLLRFLLTAVIKKAPGLVLNACKGRQINLIAQRSAHGSTVAAAAFSDTINFNDYNPVLKSSWRDKGIWSKEYSYITCFHEISHLCSNGIRSSSKEWLQLVNPLAAAYFTAESKIRTDKNNGSTSNLYSPNSPIVSLDARTFGLPSSYAATNPEECLAEFVDLTFSSKSTVQQFEKAIDPKFSQNASQAREFIRRELLSPNSSQSAVDDLYNLYKLDGSTILTKNELAKMEAKLESTPCHWKNVSHLLRQVETAGGPTVGIDNRISALVSKTFANTANSEFKNDRQFSILLKINLAAMYAARNKKTECFRELNEIAASNPVNQEAAESAMYYAYMYGDWKLVTVLYSKIEDKDRLEEASKLRHAYSIYQLHGIEPALWQLKKIAYSCRKEQLEQGKYNTFDEMVRDYVFKLGQSKTVNSSEISFLSQALFELGDLKDGEQLQVRAAKLRPPEVTFITGTAKRRTRG